MTAVTWCIGRMVVSKKAFCLDKSIALIAALLIGLTAAPTSSAQSNTPIRASYDVASIKQDRSDSPNIWFNFVPGGFGARNVRLRLVIQLAYRVEENQISGAPNWINSDGYDIEAKMDSSTAREISQLSEDQRNQENRRMLQTLLEDRFKLRTHQETKELPVYALVIAKNGPKLHEAKPGDTYDSGFEEDGHPLGKGLWINGYQLTGQGTTMSDLARELTAELGRTVIDQTGLAASYDFALKWIPFGARSPAGVQQAPGDASGPDSSGPSIFTAIQEQLGLTLKSQKGSVQILVIDHVERPSPN